jgi:hypothetical protein
LIAKFLFSRKARKIKYMGIALRDYKTQNDQHVYQLKPCTKVHNFTYMDVGKGRELGAEALPTWTQVRGDSIRARRL